MYILITPLLARPWLHALLQSQVQPILIFPTPLKRCYANKTAFCEFSMYVNVLILLLHCLLKVCSRCAEPSMYTWTLNSLSYLKSGNPKKPKHRSSTLDCWGVQYTLLLFFIRFLVARGRFLSHWNTHIGKHLIFLCNSN